MSDLTYCLRTLRRTPGFTLTAVLTLGLGLGASVAVFSIVNAIYFAALPYRDVDRLMLIETSRAPSLCHPVCPAIVSPSEVEEWKPRLTSVDAIAGIGGGVVVAMTPTGPERMASAVVSANFFAVLGLNAFLGRAIVPGDGQPGAPPVVVLSHRIWMDKYSGDSSVVGRLLVMDAKAYQIVGVMPRSATIGEPLFGDSTAALFVPLQTRPTAFFAVVARLAAGQTRERLQTELEVVVAPPDSATVRQARAEGFAPTWKTRVTPLRSAQAHSFASVYPLVLGTVLLVVLIACANLAVLFLARFGGRRQEAMVRSALGAGRGRVVRVFVTEGMIVASAAAALGSLVAPWAVSLSRLFPAALPYWTPVRLDLRVALFAFALAGVCGAMFSLAPALLVTHFSGSLDLRTATRSSTGGRSANALRRGLIAAEIACSLILLTGAGLLVKTFIDVATADVGAFAKRSVLMGVVGDQSVAVARWTPARHLTLAPRLIERLKAIPGVGSAAVQAIVAADPAPGVTLEGASEMTRAGSAPWMPHAITPEYFNANGYSLLQGHAFTDADNASAMPVGIIDEETAKHVFPGATAVGRRLKLGPPSSNAPWITIVGVVAASGCLKTETCVFRPVLYRPLGQVELAPYGFLTFVVRTRGPDESLKPAIRAAVREADPTIVVMRLFSAESRWEDVIAPLRANAVVLGGFALFALLIAGVGTYGVLAYLVNQRTAEIGIRMALGATSANVRGLVLRSVAMTVLVGIAAGAAGSFALTRLLRSMLYATSPTDPMVFAAAALTLAGVAMLAAYLPARRAAKVDPMIALRVG